MMAWVSDVDVEAEAGESRTVARRQLWLASEVQPESADTFGVTILDISEYGLLVSGVVKGDLAVGQPLRVVLPEAGPIGARIAWVRDNVFGCKFDAPVSRATVSASLLLSPALRAMPDAADGEAAMSPRAKLALWVGASLGLWAMILLAVRSIHI